ncbi:MAG: insulinase family protein [Psychrobacter sp.]|nr:insulinase family protein [Psychrobacter sp.]
MTDIFNADLTLHPEFELLEHRHIEALSMDVLISQHVKTGAMHYHLAHPSDENAFLVGFRTQPMDSKGEAHVLEHVALCGSEKFPVRDPFFSMIKRSLNTFMNAMTAADWTAYPYATQNKNDYFNLLAIYLDASFFPNIHPLDFAQEGIRVELNSDDKPEFKGIVFNEMKGAMSDEIDQLYHTVAHHLFPTTTYHYNSGGDPADIPDLTHSELVDFHHSHYHPSNSVIMSFGNIPVRETQTKIHDDALTRFAAGKKHVSRPEVRFDTPVIATDTYTADEAGEHQTHHVIAWLLPSITDPKQRLALRLLEGVLIEHAGSPLRAYLDSHPLGKAPSPLLGLDDSHYEMVFYTGLRGSEAEHAEAVEQGIIDLLTDVASKPIDDETIETILHQIEIDQRHIGGDSMPYGLNLLLEGFSTAIHDGNPLDVWEVDEHLLWLREQVKDEQWLPNLIKHHLLDNNHRVRVTLTPDSEKSARLASAEQVRLDTIAMDMSADDKAILKQQALDLAARQAAPDDLSLLPKVGLEDVPADISFKQGSQKQIMLSGEKSTLFEYEAGTNGLYYYQVIVPLTDAINPENASKLPANDVINHPLLPIYLALLSELGTDSMDAYELQAKQAAHSSGVTARVSQRTSIDDSQTITSYFVMATRALNRKPEAIDLLKEVMEHSVFTEHPRIKEILQSRQASWQSRLSSAGHAYALQTASRAMSRQAQLEYVRSGLPALSALKGFLTHAGEDEALWDQLATSLMDLHQRLLSLPKHAAIICEGEQTERLSNLIVESWQNSDAPKFDATAQLSMVNIPSEFSELSLDVALSGETDVTQALESNPIVEDLAWLVATNVYHNASAYTVPAANHPDSAALMVLAPYLRNGYLHSAIREKGGAYGGGAGYDANACAFKFFSYRDPNCSETFAHFDASIEWLLNEPQTDEQLEEAILGIISGMDKPGSPAGEAIKACFANLHHRGEAWQRKMRAAILEVTIEDLQRVAQQYLQGQEHVRAVLAPYDKEEAVKELGFKICKIKS